MSDKTEDPTPRRLRKAHEQGDSAVSAALGQSVGFLVALALVPSAVSALAGRSTASLRAAIGGTPLGAIEVATDVVSLTAPLLLAVAAAGTAVGLVQAGGALSPGKLAPDLSRVNPFSGIANLVSWQRVISVVRALVGAGLVSWLALRVVTGQLAQLANTTGNVAAVGALGGVLVRRVAWIAGLVGLALGAVDLLVTRRAWLQRLRMSKDEVRREHRESEGDPELKSARKRAHQELLRSATIAAVRDATVLIVNPTHLCSALRYADDEDEAPRILAQGEGELARRMIEAAHAWGVPVVRDVPVARALRELGVGDEIPEALYEAVAEILRELYEAQARELGADAPASPSGE